MNLYFIAFPLLIFVFCSCYLAMGEIENAKEQYMKCLQFGDDDSVDRKLLAEASEGLEKVQVMCFLDPRFNKNAARRLRKC